jgi:NAD(P)-dependent dehydrogenase (short-subunit alcohol dehydrogenase family)
MIIETNLMRRFGTAEEIAAAVLFLSCDESSFITGSALSIDGGSVFH